MILPNYCSFCFLRSAELQRLMLSLRSVARWQPGLEPLCESVCRLWWQTNKQDALPSASSNNNLRKNPTQSTTDRLAGQRCIWLCLNPCCSESSATLFATGPSTQTLRVRTGTKKKKNAVWCLEDSPQRSAPGLASPRDDKLESG